MIGKLCLLAFLVYLMGVAIPAYGQHIQVYYGRAAMSLPINSDVYVPLMVYSSSQNVWIGSLHIPLATDNRYISNRYIDNTQFFPPLSQWDDASFLPPDYNSPQAGWTSQSILGWADLGGGPNPYLHPTDGAMIAKYKMRTVNDTTLIGQTRTIFGAGWNPVNGSITFDDTLGAQRYTDIGQTFYQITFCACVDSDKVGSGLGLMGNVQNHVDTRCSGDSAFTLEDITRRAQYNPHQHNGQMPSWAANKTYKWISSPPNMKLMSDRDNQWNSADQASGVDAHVYTSFVYDFMLSFLSRNSHSNQGNPMDCWVEHPGRHNRASYISGAVFGTVDAQLRSLAVSPDLVAHEWGHGITVYEANLLYEKEPGALSESFSNMFAAAFNYIKMSDHTNWFKIGKNVYRNEPLRVVVNMANPHETEQPDTYINDQFWGDLTNCTPDSTTNDYCFVHTNSGVPNKMFYLLAAGGIHNGITVQPIGVENAFKVMYEANSELWTPNTTFWKARDGSVRAALIIDNTTHTARNVADAWNAVNLCDTCQYVPGDFNGNGEARGSDITRLVSFLKGEVPPPPDSCHVPYQVSGRDWFYVTGDYNGDCQVNGADVTWGVAYYKLQKPEIRHCPHFSPSAP